ncbi:hypothetical protein BTZ20_0561 [Rhodococcus sp. MTM3W5.2]|nr:hypothetical protein BTZ20_0561 [Rhodococcus sp. MTM3W5.2]
MRWRVRRRRGADSGLRSHDQFLRSVRPDRARIPAAPIPIRRGSLQPMARTR